MVKVFYLINSMALGGAERQMAELVRRLPRDRFEPVLCLLDGVNAYRELLPPDQPRYVIGSPVGVHGASRLARVLREERPDIVHSFMEYSNLWARLLGPLAHRPIVITSVRSRMMRPDYRLIEALLSRRCDAITVNSIGTRDELVRWQRVPPDKVRLVRNILDFSRFHPTTPEERERARARVHAGKTLFVVPGRISVAKNHLGLCAAVAWGIRSGYLKPSLFSIVLAGRVYDNWVARAFHAMLRSFGLSDVFSYLGPVQDVERLYAAADYVLLPSLYEGLPNAALEAHACGLPLVMSRSANLDGIMKPGETGFEFETLRMDALARALAQAIAVPEDERRRMGDAGRKRVLARFDPDEALQDTLRLYDELLRARGRTR